MRSEVEENHQWKQPEWRSSALDWIHREVSRLGLNITGEPEQFHITDWSTVIRVPVDSENVYFKAVKPERRFEIEVTQLLSSRHPQQMPTVLAVHPQQAWMLTGDMGGQYRAVLRATGDLTPLERALPMFAEIQMESIPHLDDFVSLGVPQHLVPDIPNYLDEMLADKSLLKSSDYALSDEQIALLSGFRPMVANMAVDLAGSRITHTIHHDDLHDANLFIKDQQICFSDWGDCTVTHPFFSLLILMRSISDSLKCRENDPRILKLRDIYLEQWLEYDLMDQLKIQFSTAWRLGMINRAYSWFTDLKSYEEPYRTRYAYTVPGWLGDFIETMQAPPEDNP